MGQEELMKPKPKVTKNFHLAITVDELLKMLKMLIKNGYEIPEDASVSLYNHFHPTMVDTINYRWERVLKSE